MASEHAASLIDDELGPRSSSIAQAVASATGIKTASAQKLMGGVASVAVAALARAPAAWAPGRSIDFPGTAQRLGEQAARACGVAFQWTFGTFSPRDRAVERGYDERMATGPAIRELEAPKRNWMIPLILVALSLLAIPVLRGLRRPSAPPLPERATPPPTQPAPAVTPTPPVETAPAPEPTPPTAAVPNVEPGSMEDLAAFLAGSGETTPHAFAPAPLTFAFASTQPTPESLGTLDDIAAALNEHPGARSASRATPTTSGRRNPT